jgi:hypothetical protein
MSEGLRGAGAGIRYVAVPITEDFFMRLVRQFAAALATMRKRRERGEHIAALEAADRMYDELLTIPREVIDRVDTPTLVSLLGGADRIRAAALLFWEEGHIYKAQGDPLTAFARYRRAHELFLEARALDPREEDDSAILELSRAAPADQLDPRYRVPG